MRGGRLFADFACGMSAVRSCVWGSDGFFEGGAAGGATGVDEGARPPRGRGSVSTEEEGVWRANGSSAAATSFIEPGRWSARFESIAFTSCSSCSGKGISGRRLRSVGASFWMCEMMNSRAVSPGTAARP